MALVALALAGGALLAGGVLGAFVGHPCDPYVYYPAYPQTFNAPYCCPPYFYPMVGMGTGIGMGGMGMGSVGMGSGFYPWSPTPWNQPSIFGYW